MTLYYHDSDRHSASVPWHVVDIDGDRMVARCGLVATRIGACVERETWPDGQRCRDCEAAGHS